jgi:VWFA-related protein
MRKKIILLVIPVILLGFALLPNPCQLNSEQSQAKKDQQALRYEVTVTLKLVQVYVTDKKGNPIIDLTQDDFILYDNGKLQKITDFEKHLLAKPEKAVEPEKMVEEKLAETKLPPSPDIASRMNRKFILLLDLDRNDAAGVEKSKKAALHFIDTQLQPTDEVGVFSYSRYFGLTIHEYLTFDQEKVKEAVENIKKIPGIRPRSSTELTLAGELAKAEAEAGLTEENTESTPISFRFVENPGDPDDMAERTIFFIRSISDLAKAIRYIPGYKNIILFSGGILSSLMNSTDQTFRENYENMSKELAASNSPVYTVNTIGTRLESSRGDRSLRMLSELSGGKYFQDVGNYEKIAEQIQNVTSNYYVLGYYIDETWDGKYHQIKVEVKRKGCEVHAQRGYFNQKPFNEFSEFEKQLHLIDLALSEAPYSQVPLQFPLAALPCSVRKVSNLILLSEIPLDEIKEVSRGKTELVTFIFDKENNIVFSTKGDIDLSTFPQEKIYAYAIAPLLPGQYECRIVLRNPETGTAAVASSSADIHKPLDSGLRLHSPLLLIPGKKSSYLKISRDGKKQTEEEILSLNDIYPFLSNEYSPLLGKLDRGISRILAIVRCSAINIPNPEIGLSAYLSEYPSGKRIPLSVSILSSEKQEETDVLLLELRLPELKAGRYSLELVAEESNSQSRSEAKASFDLR